MATPPSKKAAPTQNLSKILSILAKTQNANASLKRCTETKCLPQYTASQAASKLRLDEIKERINQLEKKQITFKQFIKMTKDIKTKMLDTPEIALLGECAINKCKPKVIKVFRTFAKTMEYQCKVEKKQKYCGKLKMYMEMLETKPFTIKEYTTMFKIMAQPQ